MRTLENQIHELDYSSVMLRRLIHLLAKHQNCVCGTDDSAQLALVNCCMVSMREK